MRKTKQIDLFKWMPSPILVSEEALERLMRTPADYRAAATTSAWRLFCLDFAEKLRREREDPMNPVFPRTTPELAAFLGVTENDRFFETALTMLQYKAYLLYNRGTHQLYVGIDTSHIENSLEHYATKEYSYIIGKCFTTERKKKNGFSEAVAVKAIKGKKYGRQMIDYFEKGEFFHTGKVFGSGEIVDYIAGKIGDRSEINTFVTRFLSRMSGYYAVKKWHTRTGWQKNIVCYQIIDTDRAIEVLSDPGRFDHTRLPMLAKSDREIEMIEEIAGLRDRFSQLVSVVMKLVDAVARLHKNSS